MTVEVVPYAEPKNTQSTGGTFIQAVRRFIFGNPLSSSQSDEVLLPKTLALPIFSSDAISSVAYATQQIVLALGAAGLWVATEREHYAQYTLGISTLIVALLGVVVCSYWQVIVAYPEGGGSYAVSKRNLGTISGLVAAGALLIDYVLTVSVSIASGVQNLRDVPTFEFMHIKEHLVMYCIVFIALLTIANLRGLKESGTLFAMPTYFFILACYLMIGFGFFGPTLGWHFQEQYANQTVPNNLGMDGYTTQVFSITVLFRAFANGCSAMTGTEAVSNGVPAFKEPKSRNACLTLVLMGLVLGSIFLGISWLAVKFHVVYWEGASGTAPAVIDQLSGTVFGKTGPFSFLYLGTQLFTALILVLAANTSFAGFPRLASLLARDGFMPRQLSSLGDKLVFNNGIILLGIVSALLIALKKGSVDALIPLYAIGVFVAFTLSQAGMVKHWIVSKEKGWTWRAAINGVGALATFLVSIDIATEKFMEGAWAVVILLILLVLMFLKVHKHYADVAQQLRLREYDPFVEPMKNIVLVLAQGVNVGTMRTLEFARSLSPDCIAVHVELDPEKTAAFKKLWEEMVPNVQLAILESPYRSLLAPILHYLDVVHEEKPNQRITIVIGEFVPTKWWHTLLHGNTGLLLKLALLNRRDVVVANVRYYLEDEPGRKRKPEVPADAATSKAPLTT
ncbi:MAG TPA: APC family permease [Oculatellaceae cyanobacterium]